MRIRTLWEPRNLGVGVYWNRQDVEVKFKRQRITDIYICILPCFPIKLSFMKLLPRYTEE